jgi:hypothetical protein
VTGRQKTGLLWGWALWALCGLHSPLDAARILATPFAELTPAGEYRVWAFALQENRSTDDVRGLYRLDLGLTPRAEVGLLVIDPHRRPATAWVNLQGVVTRETARQPTVSIGLWDAAGLDRFGGDPTGGSCFVAASKTLKVDLGGSDRQAAKVNLGWGTNRLNGLFGGAVVPVSRRTGLQVEYSPRNLRLPNANGLDLGLYHFLGPRWRLRASSMGGNPMLDLWFSGRIGR